MVLVPNKQRMVSRRALMLGGLQVAALGGLAARLYYLQFVKAEHLSIQAENNRVKLQLVPPVRGVITDQSGEVLAMNQRNYQLFLDVTGMRYPEVDRLLTHIKSLVTLDSDVAAEVLATVKRRRFPPPFLLKEHMPWNMVAKLKLRALELPGTYIHTGQQRHYPLGETAAHLIGHMGRVAENDIENKQDPLLRMPNFKLGKNGVERMYNTRLIGEPGIRQLEVNASGLVVRELDNTASTTGESIALTVDARLQNFIAARLGDESASTVVMDVRRGNVLAMVSVPSFDPDVFSGAIPTNYWNALRDNERNPLLNKSLQGQYPPGSTFKMLVGLAALKAGKTSVDGRVFCPGHYDLGTHRFNCWKPGGHGSVDLKKAIAVSCDTYFYTMAERCGIEPIAEMARRFGLGEETTLGLPGEKPGLVPSKEWKMEKYNQRWQTGDTVNVGIGQGYILATPLQLCTMTARLASGKSRINPRLTDEESFPSFAPLEVDSAHLAMVRAGMEMAVNHPSGTAYGKRIIAEHRQMAGKTGTSQVKKITQRGMDQSKLPWRDRHHAFFVAYAPIHDPRYAICVAIEHGGGGSSAAAPVAKDVMEFVQKLDI